SLSTPTLTSLILTSDIPLTEYPSLLTPSSQPTSSAFSIPPLPSSIQSLTLEIFPFGFPAGFLSALGAELKGLRSLTIFSALVGGTTAQSKEDAISFLTAVFASGRVQDVHFLDVFVPAGFWEEVGKGLTPEEGNGSPRGLRFLEISYTYRHSDSLFLQGLNGAELAALVSDELVACCLRVESPDGSAQDEEDVEGTEEGIRVLSRKDGGAVIERVKGLGAKGTGLMMLDLTMFELSVGDMASVLEGNKGLKVVSFSVVLEGTGHIWGDVLGTVKEKGREIEVLEIVGSPGEELVGRLMDGGEVGLKKADLEGLSEGCRELRSVKVSILRTKVQEWSKEEEGWVLK
ncbi:hypothetical protein B7494_g5750, partial [Chlorociboria aeruginascens]